MKKISILFATIIMAMLFVVSASAATEGYYTYEVENGEATITDVDTSINGDVAIPSELGGYSVTSIGDQAFEHCKSLTSVKIPYGVTSINSWAFYRCENITSITIPDSVTYIGDHAFSNCHHLTSVNIPYGVTTIGEGTFETCASLTSITIPDSVTSVGDFAFAICASLTSITIPDSVASIGYAAFYYCLSLTDISIPDSVTSIGDAAFAGCASLKGITVDEKNNNYSSDSDGMLFNKDKTELIQYTGGNEKTVYTIPSSVTSIRFGAFYECSNLTSITIPDSVTSIGVGAFAWCESLTSVTIGNGVTSIGEGAFGECTGLTDVYYVGSQSQWNEIAIEEGNESLTTATIHYNYNPHTHSYTALTTKEPTHLTEGETTYTCACGDSYTDIIPKKPEHKYYVSKITAPLCESVGYTTYTCACGESYNGDYVPEKGHSYSGQMCTDCGEKCSCNCHKTGISGFFWKISNFFNKLFKIKSKKMCACGIAHY